MVLPISRAEDTYFNQASRKHSSTDSCVSSVKSCVLHANFSVFEALPPCRQACVQEGAVRNKTREQGISERESKRDDSQEKHLV